MTPLKVPLWGAFVFLVAVSNAANYELVTFGVGGNGRLGHNGVGNELLPKVVQAAVGETVLAIAAGADHTIVLLSDGEVLSFGANDEGQLGHGDFLERLEPEAIPSLSGLNVTGVAAGAKYSAVLLGSGEVRTFGTNLEGQLGHGDNTRRENPTAVSGLPAASAIACGDNHMLVATRTGALYSFGKNTRGQLGLEDMAPRTAPALVANITGVTVAAVAAGADHSAVVSDTGELYTFGYGEYYQLGHGSISDYNFPKQVMSLAAVPVAQVACGRAHTVILGVNSRVYTCGSGTNGRLGHDDANSQVTPLLVEELRTRTVVAVAAGNFHSAAVLANKHLYTFGYGQGGRLGTGVEFDERKPVRADTLDNSAPFFASAVAAGASHTVAIRACSDINCESCPGDVCNRCSAAYILSQAGVCVTSCPYGESGVVNSDVFCSYIANYCPSVADTNGTACATREVDASCTPTCRAGFTSAVVPWTCGPSAGDPENAGEWSGGSPCAVTDDYCPEEADENADLCPDRRVDAACLPNCSLGYARGGAGAAWACADGGAWEGGDTCDAISTYCPEAADASGGACADRTVGAVCTPDCAPGFRGASPFVCTAVDASSGVWVGSSVCNRYAGFCAARPDANAGACANTTVGGTCAPTCNLGYEGGGEWTCGAQYDSSVAAYVGEWTGGATCTRITEYCTGAPGPNVLGSASTACSDKRVGDTCSPDCQGAGGPVYTCYSNASWILLVGPECGAPAEDPCSVHAACGDCAALTSCGWCYGAVSASGAEPLPDRCASASADGLSFRCNNVTRPSRPNSTRIAAQPEACPGYEAPAPPPPESQSILDQTWGQLDSTMRIAAYALGGFLVCVMCACGYLACCKGGSKKDNDDYSFKELDRVGGPVMVPSSRNVFDTDDAALV